MAQRGVRREIKGHKAAGKIENQARQRLHNQAWCPCDCHVPKAQNPHLDQQCVCKKLRKDLRTSQ